jgi:hypothetical protein
MRRMTCTTLQLCSFEWRRQWTTSVSRSLALTEVENPEDFENDELDHDRVLDAFVEVSDKVENETVAAKFSERDSAGEKSVDLQGGGSDDSQGIGSKDESRGFEVVSCRSRRTCQTKP